MSLTLYDKLWQSHVITEGDDGAALLHIDRHLVQEVSSPQAFAALRDGNRAVRRRDLHLAVVDHAVPTRNRGEPAADPLARAQIAGLEQNAAAFAIPYVKLHDRRQGIVHVMGPELGFTLPGCTLVCGDSHTTTHGAFGALAFGIGSSECAIVLATQCLWQRRALTMAVDLRGRTPDFVTSKDVALALIAAIGAGGAHGFALEFQGESVRAMSMAARMTLCNMSIECGARVGLVAPDDTTFAALQDRPLSPRGADWTRAVADWQTLPSAETAAFDRVVTLDVSSLAPHVTWGTSPEDALPVTARVPDPKDEPDAARAARMAQALAYMGLQAGMALQDIAVDRAFIGSCTNSRIEDLRQAAYVVRGRRVAASVTAMVVPGSGQVKHQAEREGLNRVFLDAGFEWRDAGCSMCVAMNDDRLAPGERCASTSNRNFQGRQGIGGRTHLMSPAMAAAAAIAGHLIDVRALLGA